MVWNILEHSSVIYRMAGKAAHAYDLVIRSLCEELEERVDFFVCCCDCAPSTSTLSSGSVIRLGNLLKENSFSGCLSVGTGGDGDDAFSAPFHIYPMNDEVPSCRAILQLTRIKRCISFGSSSYSWHINDVCTRCTDDGDGDDNAPAVRMLNKVEDNLRKAIRERLTKIHKICAVDDVSVDIEYTSHC